MCFTGMASPAAWILAGALLCGVVLCAAMMSAEYRNAIDLTETCAPIASGQDCRFRAEVESTVLVRRASSSSWLSSPKFAEGRNRIASRRRVRRPRRKSLR